MRLYFTVHVIQHISSMCFDYVRTKSHWRKLSQRQNQKDLINLRTFTTGIFIRKTCPCNVYPNKPNFYIEKLGYAGVYLFFLYLV